MNQKRVLLYILIGIVAVILLNSLGKTAVKAFAKAKTAEEENTYNNYYEASFAKAEKEYHVSNRVKIQVDSVKEKASLDVLEVSSVADIIDDGTENDQGAISWLEATGTGVFVVDLAAGEYLVDQERNRVLVRVPEPKFDRLKISKTEQKLFKDNTIKILGTFQFNDGSTQAGEALAQKQRIQANTQLREEIVSNQRFFESAKSSAENLIINLVKELNRDIPDLIVEVEFIQS